MLFLCRLCGLLGLPGLMMWLKLAFRHAKATFSSQAPNLRVSPCDSPCEEQGFFLGGRPQKGILLIHSITFSSDHLNTGQDLKGDRK